MSGSAISRRLMLALFAVTIVPILGWSVLVDLAEHVALASRSGSVPQAEIWYALGAAKRRLIVVLGLSLATFAFVLLYLRRALVAPLESLATRARRASADWSAPPECARQDEIGDLARALDASVRDLAERVEHARRFAADLSHELRTPLAAIRGAAELLAQEDVSAADVRRFNTNILIESQRLGRLVEGILELERGTLHPRRTDDGCELVQSIQHVVEGLTLLAERKELRFELNVPETAAWADIDSDRHDRVLFALLENALKFSPPRETIGVRLEARATSYRISVEDRGPGVPAPDREAIFERHTQLQNHGARRGTGLGLAIAKALVQSWGGSIGVDDGDGRGARFHYLVPALPARDVSDAGAARARP